MKATIEQRSTQVQSAIEIMYKLEAIDTDAKNLINRNSDISVPIDSELRDYLEDARMQLENARGDNTVCADSE